MSQYLPESRFKWLNQKVIDGFDVNLVSENSFHGYILEVDLEYPDELHELEIGSGMLSRYCGNIADQYGINVVMLIN